MPHGRNRRGQKGSSSSSDDEGGDFYDKYDADDRSPATMKKSKGGGGGGKKGKKEGRVSPAPAKVATPSASSPGSTPSTTPTSVTTMTKGKKQPLLTSDRVYHRIIHDVMPAADFDIGYEDRFVGIMYIPVEKFRHTGDETSEIPFHRVHFFRYKGRVVWDRDNRMDRMDDLFDEFKAQQQQQTAAAVASGRPIPVSLLENIAQASPVRIFPATTTGSSSDGASPPQGAPIRLASFNILFDLFDAHLLMTDQRVPLAVKELEALDADIITLQEMTGKLFDEFRRYSPSLCARYHWTHIPKDVRTAQIVLSKEPITEATSKAMSKNKRCIFAATSLRGVPCVVAAVHLISDFGGEASVERRSGEMNAISRDLAPHPLALMMGDFNFGDFNPVETATIQSLPFQDAFLTCCPENLPAPDADRRGVSSTSSYYTFDMLSNPLAEITSREGSLPRRLDRILVRGLQPTAYRRFADTAKTTTLKDGSEFRLFPSDHFGVCVDCAPLDPSLIQGQQQGSATGKGFADLIATGNGSPSATGEENSTAMAERLSATLTPSHGTALVIILPDDLHPAVNAVREQYDKAYPRWMPHITLIFPFVGPSHFPDAIQLIEKALAESDFSPFQLSLNRVNHFPARKPVVFLDPYTPDESQPLQRLFSLIQPLFPYCGRKPSAAVDPNADGGGGGDDGGEAPGEGASTSAVEYHPHCTLGQVEARMLQPFKDKIQSQWNATEFTCSGIQLIAKLGGDDRYRLMHSFPFPGSGAGAKSAAASVQPTAALPELVLEDPKYGRRALSRYIPQDPLELWMAKVSQRDRARTEPTHISQKGGMYHVPSTLLDTYLQRWHESVQLARDVPFFMEEVRGGIFRLYLDLDIKRTVAQPWAGEELCRFIVTFTERLFAASRQGTGNGGGGCSPSGGKVDLEKAIQLMSAEEAPFDSAAGSGDVRPRHPATVCDATCLALQCHTPAQDGNDPSVVYKSGYRLYFQRIFVTAETYGRYIRLLIACLKHLQYPLPDHLPAAQGWDDVCDAQSCDWERARLYGTVKRRNQHKDVKRSYEPFKVFVSKGLAGPEKVAAEEAQATDYLNEHPLCLLHSQLVRLWAAVPSDRSIQYTNSGFTSERLFAL